MCRFEKFKSAFATRDSFQPATGDDESSLIGPDNSRKLLEIAADTIIAVLYEPTELGLSEAQAIEMATGVLEEALDILARVSSETFRLSMSADEATTDNLNQAACLLKSIADQL